MKTALSLAGLALFFGVFIAGGIGWGLNIYKLITVCDFESPYKCEAVRVAGIVPPVGAIAGWVDLGE